MSKTLRSLEKELSGVGVKPEGVEICKKYVEMLITANRVLKEDNLRLSERKGNVFRRIIGNSLTKNIAKSES